MSQKSAIALAVVTALAAKSGGQGGEPTVGWLVAR